jgi:RNA polymerase sigma-70 factor (ECF subfamily)
MFKSTERMSDFEIVNRIKSGEEDAFRQLVEDQQNFVLNTCLRFVHVTEIAEDITQEVFIEVYKSINSFRGDSKLSTWIYRIAVTRSLDYLKMMKRKKRFTKLKSIFGDDGESIEISSNASIPDGKIENEGRIKILNWAMDSLAENQRVAFTLSKYEEMSYKEIAEIMGTTVSAVESLIHRAKSNLKKKLYKYYEKNII